MDIISAAATLQWDVLCNDSGIRCSAILIIAIVPYQLPGVTYKGNYKPPPANGLAAKKLDYVEVFIANFNGGVCRWRWRILLKFQAVWSPSECALQQVMQEVFWPSGTMISLSCQL